MAHFCMPSPFLHLFLLITFAFFAPCIIVSHILPTSIFIFGDSTSDIGTNNLIEGCTFRSNHEPYGRDYPGKVSTGRWSNGLNTIDYLCKEMLNYAEGSPKSYLELSKQEDATFEQGVNFASAGSGLMETTGSNAFVNPIAVQLNQFKIVREKLASSMSKDYLFPKWIPDAIFLISVGSNDIIQYDENCKERTCTEKIYAQDLIDLYLNFIEELYKLGARKFGLIGVLKMGCCPGLREKDGTCSPKYDSLTAHFTINLKVHLQELQGKYTDVKYAFGDTGLMMHNAMSPNTKSGTLGILKVFNEACCKSCNDVKKPIDYCKNPEEYAFWDDYHPTQTASKLMADALYRGTKPTVGIRFVTPITLKKLVEGDLEVDVHDAYVDNLRNFDAMLKGGD